MATSETPIQESPADYFVPAQPISQDCPLAPIGAVIRFDTLNDDGTEVIPRIHANSAHQAVGITGVSVNTTPGGAYGDLIVYQTKAKAVVYVAPMLDETFASWRVTAGVSGGNGHSNVRFYNTSGTKVAANSLELHHKFANLWFGGLIYFG